MCDECEPLDNETDAYAREHVKRMEAEALLRDIHDNPYSAARVVDLVDAYFGEQRDAAWYETA